MSFEAARKQCEHAILHKSTCKAMAKAMLQSPTVDANGYSTLFNQQDFVSLRAGGSNRNAATEANTWMLDADVFLAAYGTRIDATTRSKILSTFEVRAVMFTHSKKSETRASFSSLVAAAAAFWDECKQQDGHLPRWVKLPAEDSKPKTQAVSAGALREFHMSSTSAPDGLLSEAGFSIGKVVVHGPSGEEYKVHAMNKMATVTMEKLNKNGEAQTYEVCRMELLKGVIWQLSKKQESKFCTNIPAPLASTELKSSILFGLTKQAMATEFAKSSEDHCIVQTSPEIKLFANKDIKKEGAFKLVGLTNQMSVSATDKPGWKCIGDAGNGSKLYCKSSNVYPNTVGRDTFICKYWSARETYNQSEVNAEWTSKDVQVTVMDSKVEIRIPMIVNTKPIKNQDEIVVLKVGQPKDAAEPAMKKPRVKATAMKK